jgi:predicted lipoprotein with Yx(FWY)xxD motif
MFTLLTFSFFLREPAKPEKDCNRVIKYCTNVRGGDMLTLKRLLVIIATLLCALSIAACSNTTSTTAQAAGTSSTSSVSTTNEIAKETTQSQASKQATNSTNKQATNQVNAQASTEVNDSQQGTGQTTVTQNVQSTNNSSTQKTQNSPALTSSQAVKQQPQVSHSVSTVNDTAHQTNTDSANVGQETNTNTYIKVAQVSINGQMTNVLTTANGMTLYYDTNDTAANATCTGGCTQTWHPLLAQGQIIMSNGLTSGQVTEQTTANGNQVEYNGHPLYTYADDTAAGQVNGQGVNNVWYAASMVAVQAAHW